MLAAFCNAGCRDSRRNSARVAAFVEGAWIALSLRLFALTETIAITNAGDK